MRVLVVSESAAERARATSALALLPSVAGIDAVEVVEETSAVAVQARTDLDSFDVAVIDGDMRPKGGFSLLYELRAAADLASGRQLPAIVMVERADGDRWLAGWARADRVVAKPVDSFELAREVAGLASGAPA